MNRYKAPVISLWLFSWIKKSIFLIKINHKQEMRQLGKFESGREQSERLTHKGGRWVGNSKYKDTLAETSLHIEEVVKEWHNY